MLYCTFRKKTEDEKIYTLCVLFNSNLFTNLARWCALYFVLYDGMCVFELPMSRQINAPKHNLNTQRPVQMAAKYIIILGVIYMQFQVSACYLASKIHAGWKMQLQIFRQTLTQIFFFFPFFAFDASMMKSFINSGLKRSGKLWTKQSAACQTSSRSGNDAQAWRCGDWVVSGGGGSSVALQFRAPAAAIISEDSQIGGQQSPVFRGTATKILLKNLSLKSLVLYLIQSIFSSILNVSVKLVRLNLVSDFILSEFKLILLHFIFKMYVKGRN